MINIWAKALQLQEMNLIAFDHFAARLDFSANLLTILKPNAMFWLICYKKLWKSTNCKSFRSTEIK